MFSSLYLILWTKAVSTLTLSTLFLVGCGENKKGIRSNLKTHRVAHAGGALGSQKYTNSLEALDANLERGFKYFELDFSFTKDGYLVCLHDWNSTFTDFFGTKTNEPLTLQQFSKLTEELLSFEPCTQYSLASWMSVNDQAVIVTDVKDSKNIKALKVLFSLLPDAENRVIPKIYGPENFEKAKKIGFKNIIWTLYRFDGTNHEVLSWVSIFTGFFSVTMSPARAVSGLSSMLKSVGVPTYTHTINKNEKFYLKYLDVSEIYTDDLAPPPFIFGIATTYLFQRPKKNSQ